MANMSYCRFQNTAGDLADCANNWDMADLSTDELKGMKNILRSIRRICGDAGIEIDAEDFDNAAAAIDVEINELAKGYA